MGMDIYGINPKLTGEKPEINYETSTEESRSEFWAQLVEWEEQNPGYYFRANLWSWRPINLIIDYVNAKYELGLDTEGFGDNSGCGLNTQEECDLLAKHIKIFLDNAELKDEDDYLYVCLGMWVNEDNSFLRDEKIQAELDKEFTFGKILQGGVIAKDGNRYYPAWSVSALHLNKFINFLENCGGFNIY